MEAVAFNHGRLDAVTIKDVLEGTLDGCRTRAGRPGNRNHWVFF
jgi:hypothetical protein